MPTAVTEDTPAQGRGAASRPMLWSSVEAVSLAAMSFVTLAMLARYLDAASFGKAAIALGLVQIGCSFVEGFFHDAVVQRKDLRTGEVAAAHTGGLLISLVLALAFGLYALLAPQAESAVAGVGVVELALWMLPSMLMAAWSAMSVALLRRRLSMRQLALASAGSRVIAGLSTVLALWQGMGVWALVINQNLAALSLFVLLRWVGAPRPRLSWNLLDMRQLVGFAGLNSLTGLLSANISRFFLVLSGLVLPAALVGQLSLAMRVVDMLVSVLVTGVARVALPRLAAALHNGQHVAADFIATTQKVCLVMVPVLVLMAVLADPLVRFIGRDGWDQAAVLVTWFALAQALRSPTYLASVLFASLGKPRLNLIVITVESIGLALLMLLMHSPLAWVGRLAVLVPLVLLLLRREAGVSPRRLAAAVFEPFLAGAAMGVLLAWGLPWLAGRASAPLMTLALGTLAGTAIYAASMVLLQLRPGLAARLRTSFTPRSSS